MCICVFLNVDIRAHIEEREDLAQQIMLVLQASAHNLVWRKQLARVLYEVLFTATQTKTLESFRSADEIPSVDVTKVKQTMYRTLWYLVLAEPDEETRHWLQQSLMQLYHKPGGAQYTAICYLDTSGDTYKYLTQMAVDFVKEANRGQTHQQYFSHSAHRMAVAQLQWNRSKGHATKKTDKVVAFSLNQTLSQNSTASLLDPKLDLTFF
jgi:uncharacterized protein YcgL (UPF0745 family)